MRLEKAAGFSLLELILAMTMFSVIIVGSSKLESSVVQMATEGVENTHKQKKLFRAFRVLERDLGKADTITLLNLPSPNESEPEHLYRWKIHPVGMGNDTSQDITYEIDLRDPKDGSFTKTVGSKKRNLAPKKKITLGPLKDAGGPQHNMAVWMTDGLKLMTVNLGLKAGKQQTKKGLPVSARSFWIRSAKVIDAR